MQRISRITAPLLENDQIFTPETTPLLVGYG